MQVLKVLSDTVNNELVLEPAGVQRIVQSIDSELKSDPKVIGLVFPLEIDLSKIYVFTLVDVLDVILLKNLQEIIASYCGYFGEILIVFADEEEEEESSLDYRMMGITISPGSVKMYESVPDVKQTYGQDLYLLTEIITKLESHLKNDMEHRNLFSS